MTPAVRKLRRALEIAGSKKALCAALWISYEELEAYLEGKKAVPEAVLLAAADIVTRGAKRPR
jgi:hypothetical protein